ncbi:MAG TPA: ATP-binding protein, partial [Thermoanaerobaculia bacterium]|nr:ATP-binding protein [Thermoanaerobaculia bacterium]
MNRRRWSLRGRALLAGAGSVVVAALAAGVLGPLVGAGTAFALGACLGLLVALVALGAALAPVERSIASLTDGVRSLEDGDFSLRVPSTACEVDDLVALYNRLADVLRLERSEIYQRELLLDTMLQGGPLAILLANAASRVVYANGLARDLVGAGRRLVGRPLQEIAAEAPAPLAAALGANADGLFHVPSERGDDEVFRLSTRTFQLNVQEHRLVLLERVTPEIRRQEIEAWKKVVRVLSHELNNSLAPVSSLVHSARHVVTSPEHEHRLDEILSTVEERVRHLVDFLEGYTRLARLPAPRKAAVSWADVIGELEPLYGFRVDMPLPARPGYFDRGQVQQVLINLLRNSMEAGSPPEETVLSLK